MKIVVAGSIAFDYLMSFPGKFSEHFLPEKLDSISVSFLVESLNKRQGGCGANIAYNLALLGETPLLIGAVGKDFHEYRDNLEKAGVDTSHCLQKDNEFTASFFANSDQDGNQIASFYTGAMKHSKTISLKQLGNQEIALSIVSPDDPEAMRNHVRDLCELGVSFIYDPGQQIVWLTGEDLKAGAGGASLMILNDYELEMFKKKTGLTSDEEVLALTEILVVTLGKKGSVIMNGEKKWTIPAVTPQSIQDPTGVGDAYRAGLMKARIHGLSWDVAGRMGSLAAAYVLETDGPQNHTYSWMEFVHRYTQSFGKSEDIIKMESI